MTDAGPGDWHSPSGAPPRPRYGEYAPVDPYGPPPTPRAEVASAPAPAGWTPPPKPGIVPLRPIGFGQLLLAPFAMLRRSGGIIGIALLLQFVVLVLQGGLLATVVFAGFARITDWTAPEQQPLIAGSIAGTIVGMLVLFALSFVVAALLQGIVVGAAARATLGEPAPVRDVWRSVKPRIGRLIGWTALLGAAVLTGFAILAGVVLLGVALGPVGTAIGVAVALLLGLGGVVVWIWLYTKLSLVPSALVLERSTIRTAMARSWRLTDGHFWRTFGAQALMTVILTIAIQIITTPISLLQFVGVIIDPNGTGTALAVTVVVQIITVAVSVLGAAVSTLVTSTLIALIYIDLRMRKEGLDLVLQRHVEGDSPGTDPFAPTAG